MSYRFYIFLLMMLLAFAPAALADTKPAQLAQPPASKFEDAITLLFSQLSNEARTDLHDMFDEMAELRGRRLRLNASKEKIQAEMSRAEDKSAYKHKLEKLQNRLDEVGESEKKIYKKLRSRHDEEQEDLQEKHEKIARHMQGEQEMEDERLARKREKLEQLKQEIDKEKDEAERRRVMEQEQAQREEETRQHNIEARHTALQEKLQQTECPPEQQGCDIVWDKPVKE